MSWHFHCWHKDRTFMAHVVWGFCQHPHPREVEEWHCCRCDHREIGFWGGSGGTRWIVPQSAAPVEAAHAR